MTSQARAIELTRLNIHNIFGERDASQRLDAMADLWVPSGEALFVDPVNVCKTHEAISTVIDKFQGLGGPNDTFVELSEVECLKHGEESDVWVTRLKWGEGPKDGTPRVMGWDIVTIVGGRIKACYTFLDSQ